ASSSPTTASSRATYRARSASTTPTISWPRPPADRRSSSASIGSPCEAAASRALVRRPAGPAGGPWALPRGSALGGGGHQPLPGAGAAITAHLDLRQHHGDALALLRHVARQRPLFDAARAAGVLPCRAGGHSARADDRLEPAGGAPDRSHRPAPAPGSDHRVAALCHRGVRHL